MFDRGVAPAIAVVFLIACTVILAVSVAAMLGPLTLDPTPSFRIGGTVDAATNELTIEHRGGDTVDLTAIDLVVTIDGTPLSEQPPVPFFAAAGFAGGPTGPFNSATENTWSAGERGSLRIASTNDPVPTPDASVTITVRMNGHAIASAELDHI